MSRQARGQTIFYGWFVVAAGFAATAILAGLFSSFGVFFKPLENEFGWSRTLVSSSFTAFLIGYAISVAVTGRLADRYNPRHILLSAAFLVGVGITLCAWMNSIDQFRLFALIAGLGSGATLSVPTSAVQRWFRDRRGAGIALALVISGYGVGQLVITPLMNQFILSYGWRSTYLIIGIFFFAIILMSSLVIRRRVIEAAGSQNNEIAEPVSASGWSVAKVVATPAYAGVIYATCVFSIALQTVTAHLVPHATDLGISSTAAAAALGLIGGLSIPGRLTASFISSRMGGQKALGLSLFGMAASLTCLLFLNTTWALYGFVFIFGTFWGIGAVVQFVVLREFFGLRSVGGLIGITNGVSVLVGAAGPYMAGFIFDTTGSYFIAFVIMTALLLTGALVAILVKKPLDTP